MNNLFNTQKLLNSIDLIEQIKLVNSHNTETFKNGKMMDQFNNPIKKYISIIVNSKLTKYKLHMSSGSMHTCNIHNYLYIFIDNVKYQREVYKRYYITTLFIKIESKL